MIDQQAIDQLAAFCKLADKGYRRTDDGSWECDVPGGVQTWRPDESDDDCRVVLEECQRQGLIGRVENVMFDMWLMQDSEEMRDVEFPSWLLLASPREKCEAVLKVLGDA